MIIDAELSKIKFRCTPRRLAVRYVQWLWNFPREPNPVARWLKEMETEIRTLVPSSSVADDYCRKAENHFFFILDLYTSAMTSWIHNLCALISLCQTAKSCVGVVPLDARELRSRLGQRLVEQYNLFVVHSIALEKVQNVYLGAIVPSWLFPFMIDLMSSDILASMLAIGVSLDPDPERLQSEAESEVRSLLTFARLSACAGSCSRNTRCLLEAAKMLGQGLADSELASQIMIAKLEDEIRRPPDAGATKSRKRRANKKT